MSIHHTETKKRGNTPETMVYLEAKALQVTRGIGSIWSLIIHTTLFLLAFSLTFFGISFDRVLLVVTTVLSLEAIYLSIFIQMSVNRNTQAIEETQKDIEEIQEDVKEIAEDVENIEEHVEEIAEDVEHMEVDMKEIAEDMEHIEEDVKEIAEDVENIEEDVKEMAEDIDELDKK